jgi:hypothetical protein
LDSVSFELGWWYSIQKFSDSSIILCCASKILVSISSGSRYSGTYQIDSTMMGRMMSVLSFIFSQNTDARLQAEWDAGRVATQSNMCFLVLPTIW